MSALKDLRDIVNVSRLTFREDSDEEASQLAPPPPPRTPSPVPISKTKAVNHNNSTSKNASSKNNGKPSKQPGVSKAEPIVSKKSCSPASPQTGGGGGKSYALETARSSVLLTDRSALLDRHAIPDVKLLKRRDELPALADYRLNDANNKKKSPPPKDNNEKTTTSSSASSLNRTIEPLKDTTTTSTTPSQKSPEAAAAAVLGNLSGNFDYMLAYIDASVVSEWLNRANRYLKKLSNWHRNSSSNEGGRGGDGGLLFESYVLFCSFWIGSSPQHQHRFNDKQRRELVEMEYSIIYDEVVHAFQCGIDSGQVTIADLHGLLRAVFREYPLQLLSFRGTYLMLEYIDTLSSERHDDYKRLLSDVKCRTVNKQYAQWLLSIRSFALINMCWSVVKFYRKSVRQLKQQEAEEAETAEKDTVNEEKEGDEKKPSSNGDEKKPAEFKACSDELLSSSMSSASSSSTLSGGGGGDDRDEKKRRRRRRMRKSKSSSKSEEKQLGAIVDSTSFSILSKDVKYDYYWQAVLKNDLPDVLHYLISMKKIDPYRKDVQGRTLVFLAVMNEKPKILTYLVKRCPSIDLNEACDSGNTALHAAVNKGNLCLVEILLRANEEATTTTSSAASTARTPAPGDEPSTTTTTRATSSSSSSSSSSSGQQHQPVAALMSGMPRLDVNRPNAKCMNATALHLAVWNKCDEIALRLIEARADPMLKMNGHSTAYDLARENANLVLVDLMREFARRYLNNPDRHSSEPS